jgi:hypothetical protein
VVIGRPWEDPDKRPDIDLAISTGPGSPNPLDDADASPLADTGVENFEPDDQLHVGPAGIDDPETEWVIESLDQASLDALPELSPDEVWLLVPGEQLQVVTTLPKPKHLMLGLAVRPGEIAVCTGRRRTWSRTPIGGSDDDAALPLAEKVLVVFIRHRAKGVKTKPKKYVIVSNDEGDMLGWLDYSDAWNFEGQILKHMVEAAGLHYEVERFGTEPEFERAHPEWVG